MNVSESLVILPSNPGVQASRARLVLRGGLGRETGMAQRLLLKLLRTC